MEIRNLIATANRVFFTATDGVQAGLFSSDGSSAPHVFLGPHAIQPDNFAVAGNLFFFAADSPGATTLWVSDGTTAGTIKLREFPEGLSGMAAVGDRLLFVAAHDSLGAEPWVSDGSVAGTKVLADIEPGPGSSSVRRFAPLGSIALFLDRGNLWTTDGTTAGTTAVRMGLDAQEAIAGRTRVLLFGRTETFPTVSSVWASDGTGPGTVLLRTTAETESIPGFRALEAAGRIYFPYSTARYGTEIWVTDGTPAGTDVFVDLQPATNGQGAKAITAGPTRAHFLHGSLWSTDGTEAGTRLVTYAGVPVKATESGSIVAMGDVGFYCGGEALWRTDGSDAGTHPLSPSGQACRWLVRSADELFFLLLDTTTGKESLWRSSGSLAGTALVREMPVEARDAVAHGNGILFRGTSPEAGTEPWVSDGTPEGTHIVKDVAPGNRGGLQSEIVGGGPVAYFVGGPTGLELWKTDGTEAGTSLVLDTGLAEYAFAGQIEGVLYFFGHAAYSYTWSLWRSDGTPGGTVAVKPFPGGILVNDGVTSPVVSEGRVYFSHTENGERLWSSDGTAAGTRPLTPSRGAGLLSPVPGGLAFGTLDGIGFTDGTLEGTRMLGRVAGGPSQPSKPFFTRLGSMLLFSASDAYHGEELWRADLEGAGRRFYTVVPCRVLDTRTIEGGPPLIEEARRDVPVGGVCGIPDDAAGVVLNATVTMSTDDGFIEVSPAGRQFAGTRATSFRAGQTRATLTVIGLDPASHGKVELRLVAPGYADIILDVSGYFR